MANFAVIKDGKVSNVVVADSLDVARLFYEDLVVEVTDETGNPAIGFPFDEKAGRFVPACYNAGWTFDEKAWIWNPPIPYPQDGKPYEWDNDAKAWIEFELPTDAKELPIAD